MVSSKTIALGIAKGVGILVVASLLLYLIYLLQTVIIYILVAVIFSLIANPTVEFLRKKLKFGNTTAVATTIVLFLLLIVGLFFLFVPLIISQSNNLALLNATSIQNDVMELTRQITLYLKNYNIDTSQFYSQSEWLQMINFELFTNFFNSILGFLTNFGMGLAAVIFISFFLLKDKVQFLVGFQKILPPKHEEKILNSIDKIYFLLSRYFIGLITQLIIVFILYLIVLLIFGVDNAIIIAFLCAILNIVPYVGPLIGSVLAGILTMLNFLGDDFQEVIIPKTIAVLIGFFIVQFIDNNVSQPIIFSKSVKSHPLEIFLVILAGGFLFGILGMIIAVPLFTMLKVIGKEFIPDNKVVKQLTKNM
jgi:predicted PurR-regulated permease PerM